MNVFRSLITSLVALALLAVAVPAAQADAAVQPPVCQHVVTGPDVYFGVCADPTAACALWTYNYGGDQCYVPAAPLAAGATAQAASFCVGHETTPAYVCVQPGDECTIESPVACVGATASEAQAASFCVGPESSRTRVCFQPGGECTVEVSSTCVRVHPTDSSASAAAPPRAFCQQVLVGPDIDQGLCYDLDGQYVAGINCIVWWYSTYSTGQDRCYVPYPPGAAAQSTAAPTCVGTDGNAEARACYDPADDRCAAYVTFHHNNYVCVLPAPRSAAAASTAAPPRASCHQVLVGPDIDQGVCYDRDGETVNGRECIVWWYAKYGTGTTVCYVPQPVTETIDETCVHVADNIEARSVCYDLSRDTCQVWTKNAGRPDHCLT